MEGAGWNSSIASEIQISGRLRQAQIAKIALGHAP